MLKTQPGNEVLTDGWMDGRTLKTHFFFGGIT